MRKMKNILVSIIVMGITAVIALLIVSALTYLLKWQADKAMIGIIVTYILAGFVGGQTQRRLSHEKNMYKKLFEGILLGTIFMMVLVLLSVFVGNPFVISGRMLMIWMLLAGSACLGRIL